METSWNQYIQINKVDEEERIVEGIASGIEEDAQGEIVTKEAMAAAIPDYMKLPGGGNLREMHMPIAAGKVPFMTQDANGNTIIRAKVVDDNAWKKVKENVYTGFSIGGRKKSQVGKEITGLELTEISLVDRPAYSKSKFTLVKLNSNYLLEDNPMSKTKEVAEEVIEIEEKEEVTEPVVTEQPEPAEVVEPTVIVEETKQVADLQADIQKLANAIETLSSQLNPQTDVAKVDGAEFAKADVVKSLEERISQIESVVTTGSKARVVTVEKFEKADDANEDVEKRKELADLAEEIRKGTATPVQVAKARSLEFELRKNI